MTKFFNKIFKSNQTKANAWLYFLIMTYILCFSVIFLFNINNDISFQTLMTMFSWASAFGLSCIFLLLVYYLSKTRNLNIILAILLSVASEIAVIFYFITLFRYYLVQFIATIALFLCIVAFLIVDIILQNKKGQDEECRVKVNIGLYLIYFVLSPLLVGLITFFSIESTFATPISIASLLIPAIIALPIIAAEKRTNDNIVEDGSKKAFSWTKYIPITLATLLLLRIPVYLLASTYDLGGSETSAYDLIIYLQLFVSSAYIFAFVGGYLYNKAKTIKAINVLIIALLAPLVIFIVHFSLLGIYNIIARKDTIYHYIFIFIPEVIVIFAYILIMLQRNSAKSVE